MADEDRHTGMTISRSAVSIIVIGGLLAAACGDDSSTTDGATDTGTSAPDVTLPTPDEPAAETLGGDWLLTSGTIDTLPVVLVDGWNVSLSVDGTDIGGTAACNGYGGSAAIGDGTFSIGELSWTEMGCEPAVMDLEQAYLRALSAVTAFVVADDVLTLSGPATELKFELLAPVPDTEIVGTTWVLDTVIEGDAASNSPIMNAATLTLHDDGTLSGSTGCRLLEGEWVIAGAEIVFTSFSAVDDPLAGVCAPDSEALDGFVIGVLGDGFSVDVDGPRMTLMAQGNEGLSYTAG
jgi:heat shock protein HslJ